MTIQVLSNQAGAASGLASFHKSYANLAVTHDSLEMAVGFASTGALVHFTGLIRQNPRTFSSVNLYVGMGLQQVQKNAAEVLDAELKKQNLGAVHVVDSWPYHGKLYLFGTRGIYTGATVGSSNLDGILATHPHVELDLFIDEPSTIQSLADFLKKTIAPASKRLDQIPATSTSVSPSGLSERLFDYQADIQDESLDVLQGVVAVAETQLEAIKAKLSKNSFTHKLKTEKKSNLNVFHGKGRLNRRKDRTTYVVPRPWYEIELILSEQERGDPTVPPIGDFIVVTDDGWEFALRRQGDYGKNIRTMHDLRGLGKWLKGRMEKSGALKPGDIIDESTFDAYGRDNVTFTRIEDGTGRWYLDFGLS